MADPKLIDELARRARVSPSDAEAVLGALAELGFRELPGPVPAPSDAADPADVDALIASARRHHLGIDFLLGGHLGAVAATFRTHAFTVEAARERVWSRR